MKLVSKKPRWYYCVFFINACFIIGINLILIHLKQALNAMQTFIKTHTLRDISSANTNGVQTAKTNQSHHSHLSFVPSSLRTLFTVIPCIDVGCNAYLLTPDFNA
jgi:hypothetical protein